MLQLPSPKSPFPDAAFDVVAIGGSWGGLEAVAQILSSLPPAFPAAIMIVLHRTAQKPNHLAQVLGRYSQVPVRDAVAGELLQPGTAYIAIPDQHLLTALDGTIALSSGPKICYNRPAANPLFESVGTVFKARALGVILSGLLNDGAAGTQALKQMGGRVIAQDQATSKAFDMPEAAIVTGCVDFVLPLSKIAAALITLVMVPGAAALFRVSQAPIDSKLFPGRYSTWGSFAPPG
jgi:two-component system chemotaxis response regulator CheB